MLVAALPLILLAVLLGKGSTDMGIGAILMFIAISAAIFIFLQSPLQKVIFDERTGVLCYYWLFTIKREILLAGIEDWDGHTTSTAKYKDGKRTVSYTHSITVYTKDGDSYAFNVYSRAKMKEFDIKLRNALRKEPTLSAA